MSFDQSYLDYFHLQQDVFADDAPIPFLNIGGRGDLLENIHQTLVFAELPVLIFAAKGLGKTAIANEILNRFADEFSLILHSIDGFDEVLLNDLPQQIKQEFAQQDDASKTKVVLIRAR